MDRKQFMPQDPAFAERIRAAFRRQPFMRLIGAELLKVEAGYVQIGLPYKDDLTQQHGFVHGGVTSAIADNAGGYAAFTMFPADSSILTIEYKINFVSPARGSRFRATGAVQKAGRNIAVSGFEVDADQGGSWVTCAVGVQTFICLHGRPDTRYSG